MVSPLHPSHRAVPGANDTSPQHARLRALLDALGRYELQVLVLLETWFDPDHCRRSRELLCEVRDHALAIPGLTVPGLELFIAHCEIVCLLWQESAQQVSLAAQLSTALDRHAEAWGRLHDVSSRLLAQAEAGEVVR